MAESFDFKTLGFIGLGAMGKPMLVHLANKLPPESRIYVYDVVETVVDEMCAQFPNRVCKATSAKDVARQVVGGLWAGIQDKKPDRKIGHSNKHGP